MKAIFLKTSCLFLVTICFSVVVNAQQTIPKNYIGVSGSAEFNRFALGVGLEYERWLFIKNQFAIGAKANHIFPSRTVNYLFSSNESLQRNSQTHIMATSYFFTGQETEAKGFFLSFGAGINIARWEQEASDAAGNYYIAKHTDVLPGFDFSFGGQLDTGGGSAIRITGGYERFLARKYKEFVNGNGISLLYLKISVGF